MPSVKKKVTFSLPDRKHAATETALETDLEEVWSQAMTGGTTILQSQKVKKVSSNLAKYLCRTSSSTTSAEGAVSRAAYNWDFISSYCMYCFLHSGVM